MPSFTDQIAFPIVKLPAAPAADEWLDVAQMAFHSAGCLQLRGLLQPDLAAQLNEALLAQHARHLSEQEHDDALTVGQRRFMVTPIVHGPFASPGLYAHPVLLPLMKRLLGEAVVIHNIGAVLSLPGAEDQHVHRDLEPLLFDGVELPALPPHAVTVAIPLVGLDSLRGTTRMWPGSHRGLDTGEAGPVVDPVALPGDAVLMDYRLLHSGTANRSDAPRALLYLVYSRPWFHDHANFRKQPRLLMPDEDFEQIAPQHRSLFASRSRP
jgi:hypothetical protein